VQNRRRVVYYAILLLLILGELLGERKYIIIIFPEYDIMVLSLHRPILFFLVRIIIGNLRTWSRNKPF